MKTLIKTYKIVSIFIVLAIVLTIYAVALYDLQIVSSDKYISESTSKTMTRYTIEASRGDILDRNGVLLVSSKPSYSLTITRGELLNAEDRNGIIKSLLDMTTAAGVDYNDTFPITMYAPFDYLAEMTTNQQSRLENYLEYFGLDADISASDLFVWMKKHYGLDYTTSITEARRIMGIRYELETRAVMNIPDYTFADGVSVEFISQVMSMNYTGVHVVTKQVREYHTEYAAHVLGYTGDMTAKQYEVYKEKGYAMNATVGQTGVELAFEEYLHGKDGATKVTADGDGTVVDEEVTEEAVAGGNVYLTIDIALQEAAETALREVITEINASDEQEDKAEGGAVVVTDVNTGEVLASASYPTYNLATFNADYPLLDANPLRPMVNRATMGTYNPGSTFKMVTALAGLRSGTISTGTYIKDKGKYTAYETYQPKCWVYPGNHGEVNVVSALEKSCNYFFYWLSDHIGADAISAAAAEFGLGSKTGIEIDERAGSVASPESKAEMANGEAWYAADTLITAIGQGYTLITPVQIADYTAAIANGGTVYNMTLLKKVDSSDYSGVVFENEPEVKHQIDDSEGYIAALQQGMRAVASRGTASGIFGSYPVKIACKTGTVQSDATTTNTGVFVCYAPAENPEIAISVVVENGISGSTVMSIAKRVLDYYFADHTESLKVDGENTLLK